MNESQCLWAVGKPRVICVLSFSQRWAIKYSWVRNFNFYVGRNILEASSPFVSSHQLLNSTVCVVSWATEPLLHDHHHHQPLAFAGTTMYTLRATPSSLNSLPLVSLHSAHSFHTPCFCNTGLILQPSCILTFHDSQESDVSADPSLPLMASSLCSGSHSVNPQTTHNSASQIRATQTPPAVPNVPASQALQILFTLCLFPSSFPFMSNFHLL